MNYTGGQCVGCNTALMWVRNLTGVNDEIRDRVWNRMAYEFDKDIPTMPKNHKGLYGHKYDTYTCGHCGSGIRIEIDKYCPNCGYLIGRNDLHQKQREEYEQMTLEGI